MIERNWTNKDSCRVPGFVPRSAAEAKTNGRWRTESRLSGIVLNLPILSMLRKRNWERPTAWSRSSFCSLAIVLQGKSSRPSHRLRCWGVPWGLLFVLFIIFNDYIQYSTQKTRFTSTSDKLREASKYSAEEEGNEARCVQLWYPGRFAWPQRNCPCSLSAEYFCYAGKFIFRSVHFQRCVPQLLSKCSYSLSTFCRKSVILLYPPVCGGRQSPIVPWRGRVTRCHTIRHKTWYTCFSTSSWPFSTEFNVYSPKYSIFSGNLELRVK